MKGMVTLMEATFDALDAPSRICDRCGEAHNLRTFGERRLCETCVDETRVCEDCGSEDIDTISCGTEMCECVDKCLDCGAVERVYYRKWEDGE